VKVLINKCYGGFGISDEALELYKQKVPSYDYDNGYHITRTDPVLIEIFEEKGSEFVSGPFSDLQLQTIPTYCEYSIDEYDGMEGISDTWIYVTEDELLEGLCQERLELAKKVTCLRLKS
jgi:hypothetical protein